MIFDNPINQDQRIQSLCLKISSILQDDNLVIQLTCLGDNTQYTGKVSQYPHVTFIQIQQLLQLRDFTILSKNQDFMKLKISQLQVGLFSANKLQINQLKEVTKALNQRQQQFRLMIHAQIDEFNKIREEFKKFEIKQLRDILKKTVVRQDQFQKMVNSQNNQFTDLKEQIKNLKIQLSKSIQETKLANLSLIKYENRKINERIKKIETQSQNTTQLIDFCYQKIADQQQKVKQNSIDIQNIINQINRVSLQLKKLLTRQQDLINKKDEQKKTILVQSLSLCQIINNTLVQKSQKNQYKWNEQLKSKEILIHGNRAMKNSLKEQSQFCSLNTALDKTLEKKKLWAFKISKKSDWTIYLGICLRSKLQSYKLNGKNISFDKLGHGQYSIGSAGDCYSHSQQKFNGSQTNFKFDNGDVIYVQYDPIGCKLRYNKNKVENFQMPIIIPPQNDEYYPCFQLWGRGDSVELLDPVQF